MNKMNFQIPTLLALFSLFIIIGCQDQSVTTSQNEPEQPADIPSMTAAATFSELSSEPFDTFNDVEFVRHTGRFEGTTSMGDFSVPFEIIAPDDPSFGNGTVLVEPPHFFFGPIGRESVLGRDFLFDQGFSHAGVGFGDFGLNILDPDAGELMLAGEPVANPGAFDPEGQTLDEEIVIQFTEALTSEPFVTDLFGSIERLYSYGVSQTSAVTMNILMGPDGEGLFDLNLLHLRFWPEPEELGAEIFTRLKGDFVPPIGIGKVVFVQSESELVRTDAEQLRKAVRNPDYRVYEVAGAPHFAQTPPLNPLDTSPVVRAVFSAADGWVRTGASPPPSSVLASAPDGQIDPVYNGEIGIARDADLNALGGVRFPDLAIGRARFIAVDLTLDPGSRFPGTFGLWMDLACEPEAGTDGDEPRFLNHGDYVSRFSHEANRLVGEGFLLPVDAESMKERAAESDIGKPGSCI